MTASSSSPMGALVTEVPASGMIVHRVLIVEDDRQQAEDLQTLLVKRDFSPEIARDGGQAHSAFVMRPPDIVLLDLILPHGETGFEVCERMKRQNRNIPVLIVTAINRDDSRELAQHVGADGYLTKPFTPDQLVAAMFAAAEKTWKKSHSDPELLRSDRIHFPCPQCGKRLKVSGAHSGKTLSCPGCHHPSLVPMA